MINNRNKFIRFASSRIFSLLIVGILILVTLAFYKDYQQQQDINKELSQLQTEVKQLHGKKIELARLMDILESSNYIEKEARLRLGLKKPGEKVISVPENARPEPQVLGEATKLTPATPIYQQWFDYFFLKTIK